MIDFITSNRLPLCAEELLSNPFLNLDTTTSCGTGEIYDERPRVAKHNGIVLIVKRDRRGNFFTKMSGSIHKFGNDGIHNHDQYTYKRLAEYINRLCKIINIDPYNTILNGVEFGVNVELPFDVDGFLYNIIEHKGLNFNQSRLQIECQRQIESSGGVCFVAQSFYQFCQWYHLTFGRDKNEK